jgi:hypothetical protein
MKVCAAGEDGRPGVDEKGNDECRGATGMAFELDMTAGRPRVGVLRGA